MKINKLCAKNFLSIGEIEIDLTKYGNIINIVGENRDMGPGASNASGKCFALNTPILMYDGSIKKVQNVIEGDFVMGPDSEPRKVLGLARGREMMYKVSSKNGDFFIANESHILVLKCSDKKRKNAYSQFKKDDYWRISIKDYLKQSKHFKHLMRGTLSGNISYSSKPTRIDPYILGVWLGDGITSKPEITNCINQNSFLIDLCYYNLVGNKHIPEEYKINSRECRLSLLAGLIDIDGYKMGKHGYEITTKFPKLADGIIYLCRSLGFNTKVVLCEKGCQTGARGWYYRIYITGHGNKIPVKVKYKQSNERTTPKDPLVSHITISPIGVDDYYGFQVDEDGLFLLGNFTVTHNSSILDLLVYTLFGKLIKNLNNKEAIHIKAKKGLETEVQFEMEGHEYAIIRSRKPDELKLWKDGVDESKGGIPATQEEINKIIKLNYTAFINIVCFGQHNAKTFLSCEASDKRNIAENLLSLDKYNKYCRSAKDKLKQFQEQLKYFSTLYEKSLQDVVTGERQVKQILKQQDEWKSAQLNGIERLEIQIKKNRTEMSKIINSRSSDYLIELQKINKEIEDLYVKKSQFSSNCTAALEKMDKLKESSQNSLLSIKEVQYEIGKINKEISDIQKHTHDLMDKSGGICPVCYGVVKPINFQHVLDHNSNSIQELTQDINVLSDNLKVYQMKREKYESNLMSFKRAYEEGKALEFNWNKDLREKEQKKIILNTALRESANSATLLLEQQIENLNEQIEQKQKELETSNPYGIILGNSKLELEKSRNKSNELKLELSNIEKQVPYYEFWIKGFGDTGIRSLVINEIIPILNTRINYWLQFLVDNKIKLNFNNDLEERLERNPPDEDPFVYNAMSGGEHQRIDLGIALAFAQVMQDTSGSFPSLVCLDEVGTNLDRPGIQSVYNTICELARERQVLVITHDPDLQELLSGYETIKVIKENGYSRLENY